VRVGAQRPRLVNLPSGTVSTAGDEAITFAAQCGLILDDWQQWTLRQMCGERADGSWAASSAVLLMPRQNGKNAVLEALELAGLYLWDYSRIIHTAQLAKTAADHMKRMVALVASNPELDAITHPYFSNGKEALERKDTGARLEFITRGKKTARGGSPQLVVFDEALFLSDDQLQAILPALSAQSMNPEGAPQLVYTSSAPLAESEVLHRLRKQGMAADGGPLFFAEWSAEVGVDPADRDAWYDANPGMGIRISEQWVHDVEFATMSPEAFLTERLGVPEDLDEDNAVIDMARWADLVDPDSSIASNHQLALDVAYDRRWASFAAAGRRADGKAHVEVFHRQPGTDWVLERAAEAYAKSKLPVRILSGSPAASFIPLLVERNVPVEEVLPGDHARAVGQFLDAVENKELAHLGDPALTAALSGAVLRASAGDASVWARKTSKVDISSLVAVTVALGGVAAPTFGLFVAVT
jgi:phage terminase large subunit-like protein